MFRMVLSVSLLLTLFVPGMLAADVESDVSTRETYVGLPIILRIDVNNAVDHETPVMPDVDGLKIELAGAPSRSSQTITINGRKTHRTTVSYSFRVTPLREGSFTIPPVKVVADGLSSITKAVRIVASKSDTGDLMFTEVSASKPAVYVGQGLDMKLRIWVRPYRNTDYQVELDGAAMWQMLSADSAWGPFAEVIEELNQNGEMPTAQSVLRTDAEGQQREYILFEVETRLYPSRPGTIDAQEVRIVMNYPTEIGRSRSPFSLFEDDDFFGGSLLDDRMFGSFGNRLTVTKSRPIVAETAMQPIEVREIPVQGRPADFVGAVGSFRLSTSATPTRVQVNEPITLHMTLEGDGPLQSLQAPRFALQPDLIRDFKVPDESLAGVVNGARKTFTTSIRPLRDGVREIPPITFTFFDPEIAQFVTVQSEPIPLEVTPADMLALDSIVAAPRSLSLRSQPQTTESLPPARQTPLFAGGELLGVVERPTHRDSLWTPFSLALILGPPAVFVLILLANIRGNFYQWVPARRKLMRSLQQSQTASDVSHALQDFLVNCFCIAPGPSVRDQTVGALRAADRHDLAIRCERIYQTLDPVSQETLMLGRREAEVIAAEISRVRDRKTVRFGTSHWRGVGSQSSIVLFALIAAFFCHANSSFAANVPLSPDQQRRVLEEGLSEFQQATAISDSSVAAEKFRRAADSFQLLIDSGVTNDRLYFNLAETLLRCDQPAPAIANYRRALRWNPDESLYRRRLVEAEAHIGAEAPSISPTLKRAQHWVSREFSWVPPRALRFAGLAAWSMFWCILIARQLRWVQSWKLAAALSAGIALASVAVYALIIAEYLDDRTAVVMSEVVAMRAGDGDEFDETIRLEQQQGRAVHVLSERGDWVHVDLGDGRHGWIRRDQVARI